MPKTPWVIVAGGFHQNGGQEKANLAFAQYLIECGTPIHAVGHEIAPELASHGLVTAHQVPRFLNSHFHSSSLLDRGARKVVRRLKRSGENVRVVANGGNCMLGQVNWSHYVHGAWTPSGGVGPEWFQLKNTVDHFVECRRERRAYEHASLIIANSELTKQHVKRCLDNEAAEVQTVYLGADPRCMPATSDERRLARRKWGIDPQRKIAVFVAALGFDNRKGFDVLLNAWQRLCADPAWDVDLLVAGSGAALSFWRAQTEIRRLSNRIRFLGFCNEIPQLLAAADVLVSPVRYEAYGLNVQEAICCGVPSITSASAGIVEQFPDELSPLLLPNPEDVPACVERLRRWRGDPELWASHFLRFGATLRQRDWRRMSMEMTELIERSVCATSGASAKPKVVFLVNGSAESAMGVRARSFAERIGQDFRMRIAYRSPSRVRAIGEFLALLHRARPETCYVLDMGYSGISAAGLYKLWSGCKVVVDTGDAVFELARSGGRRGWLGLAVTKLLEQCSLRVSDGLVVRSYFHRDWLAQRGFRATAIPDGVDTAQFYPRDSAQIRKHYGLEGVTTIGLLGTIVWNARWQMCYGWELVELIRLLRDEPVKGVIVGDGDGLSRLKECCAQYGIEDKMVFLGRLAYESLPEILSVMDICLSTQTNDLPGQVRTTGKLPLYLACGRYVLATQVGEAANILPPSMLVPYDGVKDLQYPERLAARVRALMRNPEQVRVAAPTVGVELAKSQFDYALLAERMRQTLWDSGCSKTTTTLRPRVSSQP